MWVLNQKTTLNIQLLFFSDQTILSAINIRFHYVCGWVVVFELIIWMETNEQIYKQQAQAQRTYLSLR